MQMLLLSCNFTAKPFAFRPGLVWISQCIHDHGHLGLDLTWRRLVRVLIENEEEVHKIV